MEGELSWQTSKVVNTRNSFEHRLVMPGGSRDEEGQRQGKYNEESVKNIVEFTIYSRLSLKFATV